jgi:hypothetical protein
MDVGFIFWKYDCDAGILVYQHLETDKNQETGIRDRPSCPGRLKWQESCFRSIKLLKIHGERFDIEQAYTGAPHQGTVI